MAPGEQESLDRFKKPMRKKKLNHLQLLEGEIPALQRDFPRLGGCGEEDTK